MNFRIIWMTDSIKYRKRPQPGREPGIHYIFILMKIFRTKQIESLEGGTLVSEGIDANYMDMMNYAVFGLIKLTFED